MVVALKLLQPPEEAKGQGKAGVSLTSAELAQAASRFDG